MGGEPVSPQRPRGPGEPASAAVVEDHGRAPPAASAAGSSRTSLFGLFGRRQSQASGAPAPSVRAGSARDSMAGAFDGFSVGTGAEGLEAPRDTRASAAKVKHMLGAAAQYRASVEQLGAAAADLGSALYECAATKGAAAGRTALPDHTVDSDFQAAGGLHLLIANHATVLAASMEAKFAEPVRREFGEHERRVAAREATFRAALRARLQALRQAEQQNLRDSRRRTRDLLSYRSTLLDLTSQIDDINRLKFEFLSDLHAMSTELAEAVHRALASAVTAEIEVFDSIARKGWSGGGLDGLLAGCPDPFEPGPRAGSPASSSGNRAAASTGGDAAPGPPAERQHLRPSASSAASSRSGSSSNLFSVLPQGSILPSTVVTDEEDSATLSRRNSGISDIGDLTLTPQHHTNGARRGHPEEHSEEHPEEPPEEPPEEHVEERPEEHSEEHPEEHVKEPPEEHVEEHADHTVHEDDSTHGDAGSHRNAHDAGSSGPAGSNVQGGPTSPSGQVSPNSANGQRGPNSSNEQSHPTSSNGQGSPNSINRQSGPNSSNEQSGSTSSSGQGSPNRSNGQNGSNELPHSGAKQA